MLKDLKEYTNNLSENNFLSRSSSAKVKFFKETLDHEIRIREFPDVEIVPIKLENVDFSGNEIKEILH
jgi:hypothetical protein